MSTSYACSIIFGLPYKTMLERLPEEFDLDEMIDYGELDIGSIGYDSPRELNIVGFQVQHTGNYTPLDHEKMYETFVESAKGHKLEHLTETLGFDFYLTLDIT